MALEVSQLERMLGDEWTEALPPICLDCGYDLTGLPGNRCPECGNIFIRGEVKRQARDMLHRIRQLRNSRDMLRLGWAIGAAAGGVMGLLVLLGIWHSGFWSVAPLFGLLGGFPALGLGLQVLRVLRLPAWARERIEDGPDVYKGVALAILGAGMLVATVVLL